MGVLKSIFLESIKTQKGPIVSHGAIGVPTGMAPNPNTAPILFDRSLLRARQNRALRGAPATFLLDRVAEEAAERLQAVLREFKSAADIGTPGDQLRAALAGRFGRIARVDLPDVESEPLPLQPEQLDLAVSALAFQFVNDLPGLLAQIRRALKPDGFLLAAMIGGDTLTELRQSFAAAEAVGPGVECLAPAIGCQAAELRKRQHRDRAEQEVHPARDGHGGLA